MAAYCISIQLINLFNRNAMQKFEYKGTTANALNPSEQEAAQIENDLGADWKKLIALADHLRLEYDEIQNEIEQSEYDDCIFEYGREEYLVCDDDEADEKWKESIQTYIDECVLPEIPEAYRRYFDEEAFFEDAKHDGRGHSLSPYDGEEVCTTVDGTALFIYQIN